VKEGDHMEGDGDWSIVWSQKKKLCQQWRALRQLNSADSVARAL